MVFGDKIDCGMWSCIFNRNKKCKKGADGYCKLTKSVRVPKWVKK